MRQEYQYKWNPHQIFNEDKHFYGEACEVCGHTMWRKYKCEWIDPKCVYCTKEGEMRKKREKRFANLDKARATERKAVARRAGVDHEPYDFSAIIKLYGNICLACGVSGDEVQLTVDHIVTHSNGGPDAAHNVQPLCLRCNISKGAKSTDYRPF